MATVDEKKIELHGVSFNYPGRERVLNQISWAFPSNSFTVILGKNGSGKSTLLRLMAGIIPCSSGKVTIGESEVGKLKLQERARRIGFLSQQHKPVFPFSVFDVVLTGRASFVRFTPGKQDQHAATEALQKTGISHLSNRIYSELSGGEQQLVMLARLLAQTPEILLLDEPVSHLDYNNQIRILQLIKELTSMNLTVISVLHEPNMAFQFGDNFVFLHKGKLHQYRQGEASEKLMIEAVFENNLDQKEIDGATIFVPRKK